MFIFHFTHSHFFKELFAKNISLLEGDVLGLLASILFLDIFWLLIDNQVFLLKQYFLLMGGVQWMRHFHEPWYTFSYSCKGHGSPSSCMEKEASSTSLQIDHKDPNQMDNDHETKPLSIQNQHRANQTLGMETQWNDIHSQRMDLSSLKYYHRPRNCLMLPTIAESLTDSNARKMTEREGSATL